ncbi:MAG: hypothetical protein ACEY3K_03210, partial [Wolbachia sp.]
LIFVCIVLISNTPYFHYFITYFFKVSDQVLSNTNYASVSFVLSGAFTVGASLIMLHLAMCISLAVAALTFLAVGCYCSYKANTALDNVKIENDIYRIAA